jgi:hypothetical protein
MQRNCRYSPEEACGCISHGWRQTRSRVSAQEIEAQIAHEGSWYGELIHTTREGRVRVGTSASLTMARPVPLDQLRYHRA